MNSSSIPTPETLFQNNNEAGGNTKDGGINCWKNYAIKASFIQDFA